MPTHVPTPADGPPGARGARGEAPAQVRLAEVETGDAGELLTLQRAAYVSEARLYGDPELPPLVQTLEELTAELAGCIALKALQGSRIVGSVRGRPDGGVLHVGRLVVAPDLQGRGIGGALLAAVEEAGAVSARRAVLFTGARSDGNLRLYRRHGYAEERREVLRPGVELVHLTKELRRGEELRPAAR